MGLRASCFLNIVLAMFILLDDSEILQKSFNKNPPWHPPMTLHVECAAIVSTESATADQLEL